MTARWLPRRERRPDAGEGPPTARDPWSMAAIYSRTLGPPNFDFSWLVRILLVQQVRNKCKKAGQHLYQVTTRTRVAILSGCWCCSPQGLGVGPRPSPGEPWLSEAS